LKNQFSLALSTISLIVSIIGVGYVYSQLHQANEHKKWENYNLMTRRYYEWFSNVPAGMETDSCVPFGTQNDAVKKWARAYFDLYSEEYWLYKNGLIPAEMWTVRIDSGVNVNLISYPLLVRGYEYWKAQGLFVHPEDFRKLVDDKLLKLKGNLRLNDCKKNE
jgi:hypothetical protein